ncbi:MAG TPA: hypothetical protein PKA27_04540 [Fimbriimonadaceae bacterium]|nr:hypothetical protein [Fimbriimonadaceae bacterium]
MKGLVIFSAMLLGGACSAQVQLGQVDDFNSGHVHNWIGAPDPYGPFPVANAGPNGSGDGACRVRGSGSFGPGGHWAMYNTFQWAGNWIGAGVTVISADFRVFSGSPLDMRVVFFGQDGSRFTSTNDVMVPIPADNQYHRAYFFVTSQYVVNVLGEETYEQVLGNASSFMFRHDPGDPDSRGSEVVSSAYVDNIKASDHVPVQPISVSVLEGEEFSGNLQSLISSDDDRLEIFNDPTTLAGEIMLTGFSPLAVPGALHFDAEAMVARPGLAQGISFRNFVTSAKQVVGGSTASTSDVLSQIVITSNPARFVQATTKRMEAYLAWSPINDEDPSQDGWLQSTDWIQWRIYP